MVKKSYLDELILLCEEFQLHYSIFLTRLNLLNKDSVPFEEMKEYNDKFYVHNKDGEFLHSCINEVIEYISYVRGSLRRHYKDYSISFLEEKTRAIEASIKYAIKEMYEFIK